MAETLEELKALLENAEQAILEAAKTAEQDESRPCCHFRAPSQWMDDPNGIIYHNGYYHMMYSLNPNSSAHRAGMVYKTAHRVWDPEHEDWTGGITVWGHARSRDLLHWEHLPIALYPILEAGEHFIWFGTTAINDNGVPVAVYTSVGPQKRPEDTADQWLWFGDEDLVRWEPAKENPIMSYDLHGEEVLTEWRDPFVVKADGKAYLILGAKRLGKTKNDAVIALYEAQNAAYTQWKYRGVIFSHDNEKVPSCECPNLVRIGDKWVILVSPHGAVEYYVGTMDFEQAKFTVESRGMVDHSTNFYATNVLEDDKNRHIMWGAVEGFTNTSGWNGCVSLPREISLENGRLIQKPAEELRRLRINTVRAAETVADGKVVEAAKIEEGTAEIELHLASYRKFALQISDKAEIVFENGTVSVAGKTAVLAGAADMKARIFLDRTVIEIFLSDGSCLTAVLPQTMLDETISLKAEGADAVCEADVHQLDGKNLFSKELLEKQK